MGKTFDHRKESRDNTIADRNKDNENDDSRDSQV